MSGDPEQEYFSDGISEDIITDLSKIAGLMVIARNSNFTFKGRSVDVRAVGRDLGVRSVLEGSIRRAGNRVRITAQLIDAGTGAHLWADRYDRDLTDIFAVQDEVTRRIVDALKVTLSPAENTRMTDTGTTNMEAYDCFLRGRELLLGSTKNRDTFEQSKESLMRAIDLDPSYARAYAGLAFAYMLDYQNRWSDDPDGSLPQSRHYAEEAIEKNPKEPLPRVVAAIVASRDGDFDRATSEIQTALSLNPNYAMAYNVIGAIRSYSGHRAARPQNRLIQSLKQQSRELDLWQVSESTWIACVMAFGGTFRTSRLDQPGLGPASDACVPGNPDGSATSRPRFSERWSSVAIGRIGCSPLASWPGRSTLIRSGIRIVTYGRRARSRPNLRAGTIWRLGRLPRPLQTVLAGRVPEVALGYGAFALINSLMMLAGLKRFQEGNRVPRSE
jgi:TolB-like protein